jgi:hypothetical protein
MTALRPQTRIAAGSDTCGVGNGCLVDSALDRVCPLVVDDLAGYDEPLVLGQRAASAEHGRFRSWTCCAGGWPF